MILPFAGSRWSAARSYRAGKSFRRAKLPVPPKMTMSWAGVDERELAIRRRRTRNQEQGTRSRRFREAPYLVFLVPFVPCSLFLSRALPHRVAAELVAQGRE